MEPIIFTSLIEHKAFIKLNWLGFYRSWVVRGVYIGGAYLILLAIFAGDIKSDNAIEMIIASVLAYLPFRFYLRIRKARKSSQRAALETIWTITETTIGFKQGSVLGEVGWDVVSKVTDTKEWIMIWISKKPTYYFQKSSLSAAQLEDFKKLIFRLNKGYFKY